MFLTPLQWQQEIDKGQNDQTATSAEDHIETNHEDPGHQRN